VNSRPGKREILLQTPIRILAGHDEFIVAHIGGCASTPSSKCMLAKTRQCDLGRLLIGRAVLRWVTVKGRCLIVTS
jgi:hypothetical protein